MKKSRIAILDGYRAIAIISVILFHYYSRYIPPHSNKSFYPYNDQYNYFEAGRFGVHFFFIISGFVIFYTLEHTQTLKEFWKKRMARLLPAMIFTSIVTYVVIILFDKENIFPKTHFIKNLIASITFINPQLFDFIFRQPPFTFNYLNESHWSLWPEIQFYFLSSIIYFINKKKFVRNFICLSAVLILMNLLATYINGSNLFNLKLPHAILSHYNFFYNLFNLMGFIPLFCSGILFFVLFKNKQEGISTGRPIKLALGALIIVQVFSTDITAIRLVYLSMFTLFFGFVYFPSYFKIFESNLLVKVGIGSYFLYLIHENIGVLIIYSLGQYFMPMGFVLPALLIIAFTYLSVTFTLKVDNRINRYLKNVLLKQQSKPVATRPQRELA